MTVWLGILDLRNGRMICANAGHEYPELRGEDGVFHQLKDKHGFVVGGMEDAVYWDYELTLSPGDAIFVYTDGSTASREWKPRSTALARRTRRASSAASKRMWTGLSARLTSLTISPCSAWNTKGSPGRKKNKKRLSQTAAESSVLRQFLFAGCGILSPVRQQGRAAVRRSVHRSGCRFLWRDKPACNLVLHRERRRLPGRGCIPFLPAVPARQAARSLRLAALSWPRQTKFGLRP